MLGKTEEGVMNDKRKPFHLNNDVLSHGHSVVVVVIITTTESASLLTNGNVVVDVARRSCSQE